MYICLFVAAVFIATLLMSSINYFVSGHFGIEIAHWRCPHFGKSIAAAKENLIRHSVNALFSAKQYPEVLLLGLIIFILGFIDRCTYRFAITTALIVAVILLYELMLTVITGTVTPNRARYWVWIAPLLVGIEGIRNGRKRWTNYAFGFCLTFFAGIGVWHWLGFYSNGKYVLSYYDALIKKAIQMQPLGSNRLFYYGERIVTPNTSIHSSGTGFSDYARVKYGLVIEQCPGSICSGNEALQSTDVVFLVHNQVVFRFAPSENDNPLEGTGCI
jgi:hypothetical protein